MPCPLLPALSLTVLHKCLGRLCFSPKIFAFYRGLENPKKLFLYHTKATASKEVWVPINSWGASLTPGYNCSLYASFILCFLPDLCLQTPVQGILIFVFFIFKPKQGFWPMCSHTAPRRSQLSLSEVCCQGCPLRPAFIANSPPCCYCSNSSYCRLSSAGIFAPFFPTLRRRQFSWSVILAAWVERNDH